MKLQKLPKVLEEQVPQQLREIRQFYFNYNKDELNGTNLNTQKNLELSL